jgi:GxxExxY protein
MDILFKDECYKINSCVYEVNKKLGTGFLEAVYQEALEIELKRKNIPLYFAAGIGNTI